MTQILNRRLGLVDSIVRDHLYDETSPTKSRAFTGITTREMLDEINDIRGKTTDIGAIRRSLRNIEIAGLAIHKNLGHGRAQSYFWKPGAARPSDYMFRPLPTPITTTGNSSMGSVLTDAQKRQQLDNELEGRMAGITQEKTRMRQAAPPVSKIAKIPPVIRPSGEEYLPRELAGKADVETLRTLRQGKLYTLLSGPPGGGKTALLEAAFADEPGGMFYLTGDEETRVDDFVGQWYPTGKPDENYWADGPLTLALKAGGVLFVDDATLINPKAIACLYPIMDGRGVLHIKSHIVEVNGVMQPEIVKAQPGFYIVAAHNPGVTGAYLSDALSSRFTAQIWVESDLQLARTLGVNVKFAKLAANMRTRRENGEMGVYVPEMRDLLAARDFSKLFGEHAAAENLLGKAPEDFQDDLAAEMKTIFGFNVNPRRLEIKGQL